VWQKLVDAFRAAMGSLEDRMERRRQQRKVPVKLPSGKTLDLSFGPHNDLQKAIIEDFLPRFVPGAEVLYVGDTAKKLVLIEEATLNAIGFFELAHDALPDVVAYDAAHNWLFLIEAVHSANPISKLRHLMLERMTEKCTAPRVYVSVFKDRQSLRDWLLEISWETEVWLVESPDHVIHFDGEKFFAPYVPKNAMQE
jgi:type II restriction enzyme